MYTFERILNQLSLASLEIKSTSLIDTFLAGRFIVSLDYFHPRVIQMLPMINPKMVAPSIFESFIKDFDFILSTRISIQDGLSESTKTILSQLGWGAFKRQQQDSTSFYPRL